VTARNRLGLELPCLIPGNGPISFVAAEIHLGREPAGICDSLAAIRDSSCVPDSIENNIELFQSIRQKAAEAGRWLRACFEQPAQNLADLADCPTSPQRRYGFH
jgi:hypothetical protein